MKGNVNNDGMTKLDRLCRFLTKHRMSVFLLVLVITAVFLFGAFHIKSETRIWEMIPYDHPFLKLSERLADKFGTGSSTVIIAVEAKKGDIFTPKTLTKIKTITEDVELWEEVYRKLTASMSSYGTKVIRTKAKGEISVEPLMFPNVPKNDEEMAALKYNIFSNPAYAGSIVSKDGKAAIIKTEFREEVSYKRAFELLQKVRKTYSDDETTIRIVGFPMLMGWVYSMNPQTYMVFGISVIAIILVLILIFRNFQGMFSPVVNAGILTIWGLGFIGFTGINFSPMLYVLAFLVGARMIGNSHQIAYRYFEELDASGGDRQKACYETMRTMWVPNFAAVGADVAGFAVLFIAKIVLMKNLSIIMSFWMATILMTGFLVPVVCSLFPFKVNTAEWKKETCRQDWMASLMMRISRFSIAPKTRYITGAAIILVAAFCFYEMSKLKIGDATPGSPIFYDSHVYNRDTAEIDKRFDASSENLALFYEGQEQSVYDPIVTATFERFDRYMAQSLPDIYKSSGSVIDIAKLSNVTLHDGDPLWSMIFRDEKQARGLLGYVKSSAGQDAFKEYVDKTSERAQIVLYFADHTSDNLLRIRNAAYNFFKDNPRKTDSGEFLLAGGSIGMQIALNEEMKRTHLIIDLAVYGGIFIICVFSYRSIVAALMLVLPLVFANAMCASYMSLRNIGLSINTLPVAAIGAGLGVDFAIYLYSRAIEEFPLNNGDWVETIIQCICTCGKAVVYTGVTVILPILTWYFFSDMKFQSEVGFFLSLIMAANVVLCLTLHPLLLYIIKPKFISKGR